MRIMPINSPEDPVKRNKRHLSRYTGLWMTAAPARLITIILLIAFVLSGCTSLPFGGGEAQVKDGVLATDDVTVDFGNNAVSSETETTLSVLNTDTDGLPDGLASNLYELDMETIYEEEITVTIPYEGECPVDDQDAELMLGIGTTVEMDGGDSDTFYNYIPVNLADGVATAAFSPFEYTEMTIHGDSNAGTSAPYKERTRFGLFWISTTYIDGGHFTVYMPLQAHTFFLNHNERTDLLDDLEKVYNEYLGKGYTYSKRSEWPMNVTIKSLDALGYYSYGYSGAEGQIYLNRSLFENGYMAGALDSLLAHEFFHFVQLNYIDVGSDLLWLDEATATYFEATKMNNAYPNIIGQYKELIFSGVYPENNTAGEGYCRMPLIKFLANLREENFILNAYKIAGEGADWDSALQSSAGPPNVWVGDFYEALVTGEVSEYAPYTIYKNLADGKAAALGTSLALVMPEAAEIAQLQEDGEPVSLGKTTLNVGAYGAQLVAITVDAENLKLLPDGSDPIIKVSGGNCDLCVFAILGKNVQTASDTGDGINLKDFKDATGNNYLFLALVTNLTDSKQDFELSVEIEPFPTLDELVGVYNDGLITYAEVFISDEIKAEAAAAANEAQEQSDSADEDDLGCDMNLDIIGAIEAMEGQSQPGQLIIVKTGENTGTLTMKTDDSEEDDDPDEPIPFTYENGFLIFDYEYEEDYRLVGKLSASYGTNKDVIIDGILTILTAMPDDFWIKLQITGSKSLDIT